MSYDFKQAKTAILDVIHSRVEIQETESIPAENAFTYDNGVRAWVGAVFVDIVDSTHLFTKADISDNVLSRIMRSFTEQIVAIMNDNINVYEIGIRGDCVYGVFQSDKKEKIVETFRTAYCINTFLKMYNVLLKRERLLSIKAGIGIGTDYQLVIKAGEKRVCHDKIWIGNSLVNASNLSKIANHEYYDPICMDSLTYDNIKELLIKENPRYAQWITRASSHKYDGRFYQCDIVQTDFNNWIDEGMR